MSLAMKKQVKPLSLDSSLSVSSSSTDLQTTSSAKLKSLTPEQNEARDAALERKRKRELDGVPSQIPKIKLEFAGNKKKEIQVSLFRSSESVEVSVLAITGMEIQ